MAEGYAGLPSYYTESSDPITPNLGLSLKGMDPILAANMVLLDNATGGTSVFVNSVSVSNPNFNNTTPAAPMGFTNVIWQVSGTNVSAYVSSSGGGGSPGGSNTEIQFNDSGSFGGADAFFWDKSTQTLTFPDEATWNPFGVQNLEAFTNNSETALSVSGNTPYNNGNRLVQISGPYSAPGDANVGALIAIINGNSGATNVTGGFALDIATVNVGGGTLDGAVGIILTPGGTNYRGLVISTDPNPGLVPVYAEKGISFFHDGFRFFDDTVGPILQAGTGSPQGAVAAALGSIWMRTNGSTNSSVYIKESDNGGNTGWTAIGGSLALEINGTPNDDQMLLNLNSGTGITVTDGGSGYIDFSISFIPAQTKNAVSHQFFNAYSATTGVFAAAQPAFTDISGTASVAQIPNLPASIITSGQLALARGGTNADLSATGGTSFVLRQSSVGAAITASQLSYSDITGTTPTPPSGAVLWSALGNAGADLTLANAGFNTTFNQTSAVTWKWANTTTATAGGTVSQSPIHSLGARLFSSGVDTAATWTMQHTLTPTTALSFTITNIVEDSSSVVTLTIGAHTLVIGNVITLTGLTTGTWLNNQNARISSVTGTTIVFTDPTSHGTQATHAETGTTTQIPISQLSFVASGSAGSARIIVPAGAPAAGYGGIFGIAGNGNNLGFGMTVAINPAFFICGRGASGDSLLLFYTDGGGTLSPTQRGGITLGDNSGGNSVLSLSTSQSNNFSVSLFAGYVAGVSNPAIMVGNANSFTATAGNQIGFGIGFATASTTALVFAPTSGTATFQATKQKYSVNQTGGANGAVTGLLISAVETAVGGTHLLLDLQAGAAGTTSEFAINNSGVATKYAATTLVSQGIPSEIVTVDLTAQTAAITATTLISAPASGMYRISWSAGITTAAGVSSILGGTNGFQIVYTSPTDSVVKTTVSGNSITSAANTTGTALGGSIVVYAKTGTNIQYQYDYTSSGSAMAYELHIKLERM